MVLPGAVLGSLIAPIAFAILNSLYVNGFTSVATSYIQSFIIGLSFVVSGAYVAPTKKVKTAHALLITVLVLACMLFVSNTYTKDLSVGASILHYGLAIAGAWLGYTIAREEYKNSAVL